MTAWHETRAASKVWAQRWTEVRSAAPVLNVYVLLDLAQNPYLHSRLPAQAAQALFGFEGDSKEARAMPWLVQLGSSQQSMGPKQQALLDEVLASVQTSPCATLIASPCDLSALAAHLRLAMDVRLQGQASMYLAFWDPAILAALMGQSDLETRSRLEPVLQPAQSRALLGPIAYWWCWSRSGRLHEYAASQESTKAVAGLPLQLSRAQVDEIGRAHV